MSSGQFRIKVFFRELSRAGRGVAAAGVTQCPAGCRSPRLRHSRVLPRKPRVLGKDSPGRFPAIAASCARPDSSGHRVPRGTGPDMPKPSSAQRQRAAGSGAAGSGVAGLQGTGSEPKAAARRALASGIRAAPAPQAPVPQVLQRSSLPPPRSPTALTLLPGRVREAAGIPDGGPRGSHASAGVRS